MRGFINDKIKLLLLTLTLILFQFCESEKAPTAVEGEKSVVGKLTLFNQPVPQADIQIDNVLNWKTTTDNDGDFEIKKVLEGFHIITAYKEFTDGGTLFMETEIIVNEEITNLGEIKLADAPVLYQVDTSLVTISSVPLFWSKTQESGLTEYKLYRSDNPDINASNGELLFNSSSVYDTSFVDTTYVAGFDYYYRVYSFFDLGRTGGSNAEFVRTPAKPLLLNGNFEEFTGDSIHHWLIPYWWEGMYLIDSTTVFEGRYSVKALHDPNLPYYDQRIMQFIPADNFINGRNYKFSINMKAAENTSVGIWIFGNNSQIYYWLSGQQGGTDWEYYETDLSSVLSYNANEHLQIDLRIGGSPPPGEEFAIGWFDDAKIELVR